ncbi:carboxypeptidase regulatory-like domain-containing protein [Nocardioides sp. KIGAM211]|uniref:Carboxypeptidase regulatory-like domain-containing protein n=1 Tax=Nocardioides luti TaxID=2761101 RepID=A0A7X0V9S3_9ACTN|nr:carboxypeptidase-like regulatory domain-containing protein [Nocardioides luti]MBB6626262.1 carboxypeptidase regulatory-like domain-containing protein [Nocardioides luti]
MPRLRTSTRPSVWLLTVALAVAGLVSTGAATSTAAAQEPIHIMGTVTDNAGLPVAGAEVQAIVYCGCEGFQTVGETQTADDGTYDLIIAPITSALLQHNDFLVHVAAPAGDHAPEWYDNGVTVFRATNIHVPDGGTATGKDVQLAPGSHINGTVTGPKGAPLAGVAVYVTFADPEDTQWLDPGFGATTAGDGSYDLGPLPASTYHLSFDAPGYGRQRYAGDIVVAEGATITGKDARFGRRVHRGPIHNVERPAILGRPRVGQRVHATPGSWDPERVRTVYRWFVAGKPVARATYASFRPRPRDVGKKLRFQVVAKAYGRTSATAVSPAKRIRKAAPAAATRLEDRPAG